MSETLIQRVYYWHKKAFAVENWKESPLNVYKSEKGLIHQGLFQEVEIQSLLNLKFLKKSVLSP